MKSSNPPPTKPAAAGVGPVHIDLPVAGSPTQVAQLGGSGSGATGTICACGNADTLTSFGNPQLVRGMILPVGSNIPNSPPTGATAGDLTNNDWFIMRGRPGGSDIPGAACGTASTPVQNLLVVWVGYPTTGPIHWELASVLFNGVCAADTDCGSGSGCPVGVPLAGGEVSDVVDIAPMLWSVRASGFRGGPATAFNGTRVLTLRRGPGMRSLWDNGADGVQVPRIELRYTSLAGAWQLEFRHGNLVVTYATPWRDWIRLNANVMHLEGQNLSESFPQTIRLEPA